MADHILEMSGVKSDVVPKSRTPNCHVWWVLGHTVMSYPVSCFSAVPKYKTWICSDMNMLNLWCIKLKLEVGVVLSIYWYASI